MAVAWEQKIANIIAALDIVEEYRALGVVFATDKPRASGKMACYAVGREDRTASAYIDTKTGRYGDSSADCPMSLSLWDFAAQFGTFVDWQAARDHYAKKAGVSLKGAKSADKPREKLEFVEWTPAEERLADHWARRYRNTTLEAVKMAGGRIAYWPCYFNKETKQKVRGKNKVIALPCWSGGWQAFDPVAWVIWNINGQQLELYRGKDVPKEQHKMLSVGPTHGTLMNFHAIDRLTAAEDPQPTEIIWKTAGPSDMLSLLAAIDPDRRESHLVTCNASSEMGDVPDYVASVFAGHKVAVVHDRDKAGEVGQLKWASALYGVASEVRLVELPFQMREKHGLDLRDFLAGVTDSNDNINEAA